MSSLVLDYGIVLIHSGWGRVTGSFRGRCTEAPWLGKGGGNSRLWSNDCILLSGCIGVFSLQLDLSIILIRGELGRVTGRINRRV